MRNVMRLPRIVSFLLVLAAPLDAHAQARDVPSSQNSGESALLEEARRSSERAKAKEKQSSYLEAAQEYEAQISRAEQSPMLASSYAVILVLADAHLDAARVRREYGRRLKDLGLHEQNQTLITRHLAVIPSLVMAAVNKVDRGPDVEKFQCPAYILVGHGAFLQAVFPGNVNGSKRDFETAIKAYEHTLPCDPAAAPRTKKIIGYLKHEKRNMENGPLSDDNLEKVVSKVLGLSLGKWGSFVSAAVDGLYGYVKAHPRTPPL